MSITEVLEPTPQRPLKRIFIEDLDPEHREPELEEPPPKRHRGKVPVPNWLSNIPSPSLKVLAEISRPRSVPAKFSENEVPLTAEDLRRYPKSRWAIDEMGDLRDYNCRRDDDSSSQRTSKTTVMRVKTTSLKYRSVLEGNDVVIDSKGSKISPAVRQLLDREILKKRTSPPLSYEAVDSTMTSMIKWGNSTENAVNGFINSHMFPAQQQGVSIGGNSQWPTAALPYDPNYGLHMAAPKPDFHVGYTPGIDSAFSKNGRGVIDHPCATAYTKPGTGNILPFLTVELKSEATGGTSYQAENQAAGSGTYSLRAIDWLLDQAKASQVNRQTDTMTFSMAGTGRLVVLSVHWYSPEDRIHYMSYVKGFQTSEPGHIQACNSTVKNIVDWAVGTRHDKLKDVLQALFPLTRQWSEKRTATAAQLDEPRVDEEEEEVIVVEKRVAKSRRSATPSLASTQPLGDRRSSTTKDSSMTRGLKQGSKEMIGRL
ncbi:MAG: hypothetical protein LQ342_008530 [Letrouitia transgressa]|nr:MAG: hypothetical protein LQ342_008530 [Letrouitia transgressa]